MALRLTSIPFLLSNAEQKLTKISVINKKSMKDSKIIMPVDVSSKNAVL